MKNNKKIDLINIDNFIENKKEIEIEDETFKKLMFIYYASIKEVKTKLEILKEEITLFYHYDLIDHIVTRIKTPKSIIDKMKKRGLSLTYKNMIENLNDIAGIRIVCPLKKDIFSIKKYIEKLGFNILKEKDYVTHPKKSGYSSYHLIVEVPVNLLQKIIFVKCEIQIRTIAMDFWANLEHKMKYKPEENTCIKNTNEWISCAKVIHKLDNKMMLLNEK